MHVMKSDCFQTGLLKGSFDYNLFMGHFIPSGAPMDGKVSDRNDTLVCYVYKYKKQLFKSTFG